MPDKVALELASQISRQNVSKEGWTTYYVDDVNGNDGANGLTWDSAFATIQHAVDTAESWARIFVKAGTYVENVNIPSAKSGIHIIGENRQTTVLKPSSSYGMFVQGDDCFVTALTAIGFAGGGAAGINVDAKRFAARNLIIGNQSAALGKGIYSEGDYGDYSDILIDPLNLPAYGIQVLASDVTIHNCFLEDVGNTAILLGSSGKWCRIHDNTIISAGTYGLHITGIIDYTTIFHNNFIASVPRDDTGRTNHFSENFYSTHTTDTNNDGLCDTPYVFTGGTDNQPVSHRNGWKQVSLGAVADAPQQSGRAQVATTTIDLNQAAATYDLFTGTSQNVVVEGLIIRMPNSSAGGALTSVSVHTDDSTQQVFISPTTGDVANLAAQAQLASNSPIMITTGQKIQLTIAGGPHGSAYECTVIAIHRAVTSGGYLA